MGPPGLHFSLFFLIFIRVFLVFPFFHLVREYSAPWLSVPLIGYPTSVAPVLVWSSSSCSVAGCARLWFGSSFEPVAVLLPMRWAEAGVGSAWSSLKMQPCQSRCQIDLQNGIHFPTTLSREPGRCKKKERERESRPVQLPRRPGLDHGLSLSFLLHRPGSRDRVVRK